MRIPPLTSRQIACVLLALSPLVLSGPPRAWGQAIAAGPPSLTASPVTAGPHGGTLRQTDGLQLETVVAAGGIQLFAYDRAGTPLSVPEARGAASLRVAGGAKRYRYDLLPDGKGGLTAPVNLSAIGGRQIELTVQIIGLTPGQSQTVAFREVATVPVSPQQQTAAAIARQKVCPVSGKPLGSMGSPIAVEVDGQDVYVCCAGCVDAVKEDPAQYAGGRLQVVVRRATPADAPLIAKQAKCPVMDEPLGSMGGPVKLLVGDQPLFLCCKGCIKKVKAEPRKYLAMVYGETDQAGGQPDQVTAGGEAVRPGVFKVTAADQPFIAAQKRCPVMDEPLDAMGGPYKVHAAGQAIYICCPGCAKRIAAEPQKYIATLSQQGVQPPRLR